MAVPESMPGFSDISFARRLIFSRASRFICSFICEYFLKMCESPCRSNWITHASATPPALRTDDSDIALFYAPHRAAAAVGTSLTIGGKEYVSEPTQSRARLGTFYATDMTIGQILPGMQLWRVESGDLHGCGKRRREYRKRQIGSPKGLRH